MKYYFLKIYTFKFLLNDLKLKNWECRVVKKKKNSSVKM